MNNLSLIHGSKKGSKQPHRPHIAPDTLVSQETFKALYGLCEGEIYGLADGGKSIKLDGTPLINDNGQPNFTGVNWEFRAGTLDQNPISGFNSVENEQIIGVELRSDKAWTKAINNRELSAVRVRLNFNSLREQKDNGDVVGLTIEYAFDVQTNGGAFIEVGRFKVSGKSSSGFKRSHRIELPQSQNKSHRWTLRVRRITPNRNSDLVSDTVHIDALTEIIDAKLAYPCTAVLGLSYNAKTFSNVAKIAVRLKGKIIQVPTNYDPDTRTYTGLWDGAFKMAYSNNPAWVYYDICVHKRYGLGERLSGLVDKWRLYQIGQYCDELVDDGKGGQEPRFAINVYIQKAEDAYLVLQNIASVFRGMSFWDGQNIVVDADTPKDPVYTFSRANVVGGEFVYQGTRARDRHTLISVAWSNPDNEYKTEYEPVADEQAIARYGIKKLDIAAWGCTSKGQAQRAGLWALKSEQLETQTVSFKTGLQGFIPQVGQVINIADDIFVGRAISGRIISANAQAKQLTLDRQAGKVGDTITLNTAGQVQTAKIVAVNNTVLTLDKAVGQTDDVWAIISDDLKLMQFRILSIAQNDDATFDITALQYARQKYDVVDTGANIIQEPLTILKATPITAPNSVTLMANTRTHQGQAVTTLTINWEQVQGATAYIVEWRKDDGNWMTLPKVSGQSVDIDGVYAGAYLARVRAVDSFDNESLATSSQLTQITGKTGRPPRLARLNVQGKLFGMDLAWTFNKGSDDTNFTEIQVSPDGRSNITTLGTFAYPTNGHTINGLQGNLTQYYRARIVDKLGNTSDWTDWVSGTTSADADKVLDILSGHISESHLDQTLRTPIGKILPLEQRLGQQIGKIGSLENAVAGVNGQLGTLNQSLSSAQNNIATTQRELNTTKQQLATAQNKLNTAVANITTERNRITSAIRDITALQSANNAKTQEIANLTQTVNGHTSSIRELGVTTGDLSQKYSQLKTVADKATSDITAIKQTQAGQATAIEQMNSKFGWQTLTSATDLNTLTTQGNYFISGARTNSPVHAWTYVTVDVPRADRITQTAWADNAPNITYRRTRSGTTWTAWEKMATGAELNTKASSADVQTLRQTVADSDSALGRRIDSVETAYRQADTQANAKIDSEITARTSADSALSTRIDNLQSEFNGNKSSVANQLKTLSDKDTATATQISQITANVTTAQNTANIANGKADTATTKADNAQRVANTATANITAEQKARADADGGLANRITALDAAYKKSDTDLTARITAEEKARADRDNAVTQKVTALESTVGGINGRVGKAESKITGLERTTADLNGAIATAQSQLNARFDNLAVGSRNLLLNSGRIMIAKNKSSNWNFTGYQLSQALVVGQTYTFSADVNFTEGVSDKVSVLSYKNNNLTEPDSNIQTVSVVNGKITGSFIATVPNDGRLLFYAGESGRTYGKVAEVKNAKLERGNIPTDWTPAPEDMQVDLSLYATNASLNEFKHTQATKDTATAQKLSQLESNLGQKASAAALNEFKQTQAEKDNASSQKLTQLQASLESVDNRTKWKEITTVTDLNNLKEQGNYFIKQSNNPNAPVINWVYVSVDKANNARIKQTVWADNHASNIYTRLWTDNRWLAWEQTPSSSDVANKASATALNELTTRVQNVDGKITAEANKIATMQTTVNSQTVSIRNVEQSVNGVKAVKAVTVDNNGFISGYGLMSELQNGRVTSHFGINADQIYFGATTTAKKPFVFTTRTTTIDGVSYPAGAWLNSASIANASIKLAHIDKASIGNLSALSANIGHFKSAETGARLEIKDSLLSVYDENNVLRVRLGLW